VPGWRAPRTDHRDAGAGGYEAFPDVCRLSDGRLMAVFYAGYEVECPYLRYALIQKSVNVPMLASDGCFLSATIDESNETAEGMYVSAFGPSPWAIAGEEWITAYQDVEYRNPDTYSLNGYVAMNVLLDAARQAGNLDSRSVAEAIRKLDFDSMLGHINYEMTGDLKDPSIYIFQVKDAAFVQVFPEDQGVGK